MEDGKLGKDKAFIPGPNRIFVFGSNLAGIHGGGAALTAKRLYGAVPGVGSGLRGNSYAIPTKDENIDTLPLTWIRQFVAIFLEEAGKRPELVFFVTRIGCGLAGYTDADIAPMFKGAPANVELPYGWENF